MAGHIIYVHDTIPAPPEAVWEVLTDVDHADEVFRSVKESVLLDGEEYDVGTTWRESRTMFGHHGEEQLKVVECEAPNRSVVETTVGKDIIRTAYRLTPAGPDQQATRFAMTTTLVDEGRSTLGKIAWEMFGGFSFEQTRRMLQHDLEDIEAEVKRRATAA
jgi:uncharacterized protein YndB with AHSA1/START domain